MQVGLVGSWLGHFRCLPQIQGMKVVVSLVFSLILSFGQGVWVDFQDTA